MAESMSPVFLDTIGPLLAAALYAGATIALVQALREEASTDRNLALLLAGLAAIVHAVLEYHRWAGRPLADIDVITALSLCALVVVALWATTLTRADAVIESGLFALPIAALINLLEWFLPAASGSPSLARESVEPGTMIHVISSVLAFGLLSLAGVYAGLVLIVDHSLKRHRLNRFISNLPPLDKLEHLLFSLIATGFIILTIALVSGLIYVDDLMAQHLVHKTVLAFLAWVVFGTLLLGRWLKGWRGALAVRLTLAGIGLLLLSYFGSKLVLEVVLDRSWYS